MWYKYIVVNLLGGNNLVKLDSKYVNPHVFSLLVLGQNHIGNSRVVHLPSGVFECRSLKVMMIKKFKERFRFSMHGTMGMFISCADGMYTLPITSDITLTECTQDEAGDNFIEVISRGFKKLVKVGIFNENC